MTPGGAAYRQGKPARFCCLEPVDFDIEKRRFDGTG